MKTLLLLLALTSAAAPIQAQTPAHPFLDPALPMDDRITNLLSLMTLDEKIDCLSTRTGVPRLNVPSFGNSEGIHGVVQRGNTNGPHPRPAITTTQFPQPPGMGESWDPDLVRQAAAVEATEARFISQTPKYDHSILQLWGPQADLARDPRWGRSEEVYGEDPFFNGTMVTAFVHGLQGDDPKYWLSAALLKHFLANSNENFRTSSSSNFDQRLFWEYYSVPFRMGFLEGGAKGVMASYNAWNGTPMAVNPILKSILRDQWGVEILSGDGGAIKLLSTAHKRYPTMEAAVAASAAAGINQFLDPIKPEATTDTKNGSLTEPEIDDLLRLKFRTTLRLGLLDPPDLVPYASIKNFPEPWNTAKHMAISEKLATESVVLLKNSPLSNSAQKDWQGKDAAPLLPLHRDTLKSIAVIGPLADSVHWDWYGGTPPHIVTPLQGIRTAAGPAITVNYAADESGQAAFTAAHNSDVAIVLVGNDPTCGPDMAHDWHDTLDGGGTLPCSDPGDGREGRDRETINLAQEQLIKQVYAANPRTIVVLISSFPFAINWTQANIPAILHMAHSSQDEGTALARILFGDANPAGRTVVTWPRSVDQLPPMTDYDIRHGRTYMYFKGDPLYPFGFGLSYTTFAYANLHPATPTLTANATDLISVDVTNTGHLPGDEVVQLYVHHTGSKVTRPNLELKGFQRVTLAPGETRTVQIPLKASTLTYWDEKSSKLILEPDTLSLQIGSSSADLHLTTTLQIK